MIIKSAIRTLRRAEADPGAVQEALQDIDQEVVRLNRIVSEVLDYAKPITFAWQMADLNEICRESVRAVEAAEPDVRIALALAADVPPLLTDADRLRTVLVNVLSNAVQAVRAARTEAASAADGPGVDEGAGIEPAMLARVFEPYFTTRRAGTGLGLAIARNIVEGLGGTIAVASASPRGTEVRIQLPSIPPENQRPAVIA